MRARLDASAEPAIPSVTTHTMHNWPARAWLARLGARPTELVVVAVACLAVVCLFYREIMFEHRTFLPFGYPAEVMGPAPPWQFTGTLRSNPYRLDAGGSGWQLEPWAALVAASYADGQVPLWNSHEFFGTPLDGDAQPGAFDVLRLPPLLTRHAWGWDLYYLSEACLSLALTYAFARSVGLRTLAAFVAAVAFTFSGFMFIRGNMHYVEVYHLLPGLLWGIERVVRGAFRSGMLIVTATVSLSILVGMPETTLLAFLYAAGYAVFRGGWDAAQRGSLRFALERWLLLGVATAVGIGLSAPMLAPLVEYIGQSYNIHPPERGLGLLSLPVRALGYWGVPYIAGLPTQGLGPGPVPPVDDYSGAAVIVLAITGALSLRDRGVPRTIGVFSAASSVIWGAKLFGLPGLNLLGGLPLLAQTLIYIFGSPMLTLSLVLLATVGLHRTAMGDFSRRRALIAAGVFVAYLAVAVIPNWETLRNAGARHALGTLGLAIAAGACVWIAVYLIRSRSRSVAVLMSAGVTIAELLALAPRDVYSDRYDSLAQPPFVTWLQGQLATGQPFRVMSNDGLLYPDYASAYGLDDVRAIDALYPSRTWEFVHTFLSPTTSDRYVGGFGHPELPTDLFANKWLDLSNVRYILRPAGQSPADATLAQVVVAANYPPTPWLHVAQISIDGVRREVLDQAAPSTAVWHLRPSAAQAQLTFFVGLNPQGPAQQAARFRVLVTRDAGPQVLFERTLDLSREADRHWIDGSVDLSPYVDQSIDLTFQTEPLGGSTAAPVWGDLHFNPLPDPSQFTQVYAGEVSIWENTHAAPRAFLVGRVQPVETSAAAIARMQAEDFDPRSVAVVEGGNTLESDSPDGAGTAQVTRYGQQQVEISVDARTPALLVLTDSFYPGWTARVDGTPTPVVPTDLAFRGVAVPPGPHRVTFEYTPRSFAVGVGVTIASLFVLALALWRLPRLLSH